jgi:hypothetical protein
MILSRTSIGISLLALLLSCTNSANQVTRAPLQARQSSCTPQQITAIYPEYVYDLNGYQMMAGGSAFNLFDEASFVDPKGKNEYHPTTNTNPVLKNTFYWPKGRGNRIVVDLQIPYRISEVYLYDMARQADSVWIYTGNMQQWKLKAAMSTKGDFSQWGWRRLSINDSSRYIMIRFNSWEAEISEAVFYGCPFGTIPKRQNKDYTGPRLPAKTLREFLGINTYQGIPLKWMKPFHNIRLYTPADYIDRDTVNEFPKQEFNIAAQGWWNGGVMDYTFYADSIARYANGRIWYSLKGVPYWMKTKGLDDWDRPVDKIGLDTEDPFSYGRHASMLWHLAAFFGNTPVDTNLLQVYNRPRFSARNTMNVYENGNEVDANWVGDKYCNPMEYFAISSADYDGHEGRMGKRAGLKNADPNSELMISGMVGPDTNRLRVLDFISRNMRNDKKFIWKGGIQYHHYSADGRGRVPGEGFIYSKRGLSPEEDSLRSRMTKVRNYTYKIAPDVECILGEYGYDKNQKSPVSVPIIKGMDARQSQGIMLLRGINAIAFSGFDRLTIFWIKDDYDENQKGYETIFLSSGIIRDKGNNQFEPFAAWYHISTMVNHLGDYIPEKVISEKGNVWVYRYRHKSERDSYAYFVYCPTYNGTHVDNYELRIGSRAINNVAEISLKDDSETGVLTGRSVSNGVVKINVTESPKIILVKEK